MATKPTIIDPVRRTVGSPQYSPRAEVKQVIKVSATGGAQIQGQTTAEVGPARGRLSYQPGSVAKEVPSPQSPNYAARSTLQPIVNSTIPNIVRGPTAQQSDGQRELRTSYNGRPSNPSNYSTDASNVQVDRKSVGQFDAISPASVKFASPQGDKRIMLQQPAPSVGVFNQWGGTQFVTAPQGQMPINIAPRQYPTQLHHSNTESPVIHHAYHLHNGHLPLFNGNPSVYHIKNVNLQIPPKQLDPQPQQPFKPVQIAQVSPSPQAAISNKQTRKSELNLDKDSCYNFLHTRKYLSPKLTAFETAYLDDSKDQFRLAQEIGAVSVELDKIPKQNIKRTKKYMLVLDIDETLVHSEVLPDGRIPKEVAGKPFDKVLKFSNKDKTEDTFGVRFRPYLMEFIQRMSKFYDLGIYTASLGEYMEEIVKILDPNKQIFCTTLHRDHCVCVDDIHIKTMTNFEGQNVILIDNLIYSYSFQLKQGIPILPFVNDPDDVELKDLATILEKINEYESYEEMIQDLLGLDEFYSFMKADKKSLQDSPASNHKTTSDNNAHKTTSSQGNKSAAGSPPAHQKQQVFVPPSPGAFQINIQKKDEPQPQIGSPTKLLGPVDQAQNRIVNPLHLSGIATQPTTQPQTPAFDTDRINQQLQSGKLPSNQPKPSATTQHPQQLQRVQMIQHPHSPQQHQVIIHQLPHQPVQQQVQQLQPQHQQHPYALQPQHKFLQQFPMQQPQSKQSTDQLRQSVLIGPSGYPGQVALVHPGQAQQMFIQQPVLHQVPQAQNSFLSSNNIDFNKPNKGENYQMQLDAKKAQPQQKQMINGRQSVGQMPCHSHAQMLSSQNPVRQMNSDPSFRQSTMQLNSSYVQPNYQPQMQSKPQMPMMGVDANPQYGLPMHNVNYGQRSQYNLDNPQQQQHQAVRQSFVPQPSTQAQPNLQSQLQKAILGGGVNNSNRYSPDGRQIAPSNVVPLSDGHGDNGYKRSNSQPLQSHKSERSSSGISNFFDDLFSF